MTLIWQLKRERCGSNERDRGEHQLALHSAAAVSGRIDCSSMRTWQVAHEHRPPHTASTLRGNCADVLHDGEARPRVDLDVTPVLVRDDELDHASRCAGGACGGATIADELAAPERSARVVRIETAAGVVAPSGCVAGWRAAGVDSSAPRRLATLTWRLLRRVGTAHDGNLLRRLEREILVLEPLQQHGRALEHVARPAPDAVAAAVELDLARRALASPAGCGVVDVLVGVLGSYSVKRGVIPLE